MRDLNNQEEQQGKHFKGEECISMKKRLKMVTMTLVMILLMGSFYFFEKGRKTIEL